MTKFGSPISGKIFIVSFVFGILVLLMISTGFGQNEPQNTEQTEQPDKACAPKEEESCRWDCQGNLCEKFVRVCRNYNVTPEGCEEEDGQLTKNSESYNNTGGSETPLGSPTDECLDSDSGKDYFNKGIVDVVDSSGNIATNKEDSCEGDILLEQYCENGEAKEKVYDCKSNEDLPCKEGKCSKGMEFETPVLLRLNNPSYKILMHPEIDQFIGDNPETEKRAVLMAHPKVFSERKIADYNKARTFYRRDEFSIVTEYDPLIVFANVVLPEDEGSNKDKEVRATFTLQGEKKEGKCERYGTNPGTEGYLTWLCHAEFDWQEEKRGQKMHATVEATDGDEKIETVTNDIVIAEFVYPVTRIQDPLAVKTTYIRGKKIEEKIVAEWGDIVQQINKFRSVSALAYTGIEMMENPKTSNKFVFYQPEDEPFEARAVDTVEKLGNSYKIKDSFIQKFNSIFKYDKEKDKIIFVADHLVDLVIADRDKENVYGFTFYPDYKFVVVRPDAKIWVLTHEFGHVYPPHFCEEYSVTAWLSQNFTRECANQLPKGCWTEYRIWLQTRNPLQDFEYIEPTEGEVFCIKDTTIMGSSPITYERYPNGGSCPIGGCS